MGSSSSPSSRMPVIKPSGANDGGESDDNMSIDNGGDSSSRAADSSAEDESDDSDMDEVEVGNRVVTAGSQDFISVYINYLLS